MRAITAAAALAVMATAAEAPAMNNNTLTPSVTVDTRYDSNVRFRNERERVEDDFITSVTPRLAYARRGARYGVRGFYNMTADYHTNNPDLNNISHGAGLDFDAELSHRWGFGAGDRVNYYEDSLRSVGEGILVTRTDILTNTAYARLTRQLTANTSAALNLSDRIEEYDDAQLVDSRTDEGTLSLSHQYSHTGSADLYYSYTVYDFDDPGSSVTTHAAGAGFRQALTSTTTLELGGGVEYATDFDGGGDELFITGNAQVEKAYKDSYMTLSYEREVATPTGLADEISVRDSVNFIWDFAVSRDVAASFYTGLARNRSEPSRAVAVNSYIVEVSGNWQPYRWLLLGAGLSHYQQWSDDSFDIGLRRNKVFLNATLIAGEWRF